MEKTKRCAWLILLTMACIHLSSGAQEMNGIKSGRQAGEGAPEQERGLLFEWGNYAMFIHWGLYSQLANRWEGRTYYGIGEWIMNFNMANIPVDEYRAVARSFNPSGFDAGKIVQLARDAGMKYIIITSKHHDGFAMYHSRVNRFNIVDATPFGRDPMKELSDACHEAGLGFGFYYSHNQDWTYPGGSGGPKVDRDGNPKTFDDYFAEKCLPQVEEITREYGDIELIWFDTPGRMPEKYARQLVDVVHRNQPRALVSGRVGYDMGDYRTFGDMEIPLENVDGLWEGVDVTNDSWGYAWYDENWKTPKQILSNLISTVARGGTYMLNVGPDSQGHIPAPAQDALRAAGKWLTRYPQVVYGAGASPWKHALPWGDAVVNNGKIYLAVYRWPATGQLCLPGLTSGIASVRLLASGKKGKLSFVREGTWTVIQTPAQAPDRLVSVIEIEPEGEIRADASLVIDPEFGADLSVKFSKPENCNLNYNSWMEKFGEWKHIYRISDWTADSRTVWEVDVKTPGHYLVELTFSGNGPRIWSVETGEGRSLRNRQNSAAIYHTQPIGWISFEKAGKQTLTVRMPEGERTDTHLTALRITPVETGN
ncbi:MAG: alpha-L-fucosidase [Tannerella sp.]|jgi:alpha-L-fucosidase|nr:alpha-L-fucosidase [Tannerella sp.]